jgi:two-component system phosphate regulon response regulator OmpR
MGEQPHILVVDDERRIRTMLNRYLSGEGFRVSEAADGAAMRAALESDRVDLVLLDLVMPGEDGLSLARHIRQRSDIPVIMLTGKGDLIDRVVGLEAGADDYIAKPFHLREVLARIRTVMRRAPPQREATSSRGSPAEANDGEMLVFQGWQLDVVRRELRNADGDLVPLTAGEFDLLHVLVRNPNRVLNRDHLMTLVKGRDWAAFDRAIDTQVTRLRKKVESDPKNPTLIKTVRGAGYIFTAAVKAEQTA